MMNEKGKKHMFKNAMVLVNGCEIWGNKGDGIKLKLMRCQLFNCRIR